jgi:hypothetical protein
MPCDVWKLANVSWGAYPNCGHLAEIVIIIVRGQSIGVRDVAASVPQSLVITNRIAGRTRSRTRRPGDEYSRSGIPRSVIRLNEIIVGGGTGFPHKDSFPEVTRSYSFIV